MKKQVQVPGIRKWFGDDFLNIDQTSFDLIEKALCSEMGNVILSGIKRTENLPNYNWSEGYCIISGIVCTFDGFSSTEDTIYLVVDDTNVTTRNYINNTPLPIVIDYRALAQTVEPESGDYIIVTDGGFNARLALPYTSSDGTLSGIPKTDDYNLDDTNVLPTSKALVDMGAFLFSYIQALDENKANKISVSELVYGAFFLHNQTVIFYEDERVKVYYNGITKWLQVQNKLELSFSLFVESFNGSNQYQSYGASIPESGYYWISASLDDDDVNYRLNVDRVMRFRLIMPDDTVVFGTVSRTGNSMNSTIYKQN